MLTLHGFLVLATEKQKQLAGRFERNPGTMTLPHPKKSRGKAYPSEDAISLNEVSMSSSSTLSTSSLMKSRHLSSSMLNMSEGGELVLNLAMIILHARPLFCSPLVLSLETSHLQLHLHIYRYRVIT